MTEYEPRIRQLERDQAYALARLEAVENQQHESWEELRRISREARDEFSKLREEMKADRADRHAESERLLAAVNANKIAWSMMNGGAKALAWIIGTLIGLTGLIVAGATAIKRLFLQD